MNGSNNWAAMLAAHSRVLSTPLPKTSTGYPPTLLTAEGKLPQGDIGAAERALYRVGSPTVPVPRKGAGMSRERASAIAGDLVVRSAPELSAEEGATADAVRSSAVETRDLLVRLMTAK